MRHKQQRTIGRGTSCLALMVAMGCSEERYVRPVPAEDPSAGALDGGRDNLDPTPDESRDDQNSTNVPPASTQLPDEPTQVGQRDGGTDSREDNSSEAQDPDDTGSEPPIDGTSDGQNNTSEPPYGDAGGGEVQPLLSRTSRCTTIDITEDDSVLAAVNTESDSVAFFDAETGERKALVAVADEPTSIVLHPNGSQAFVVSRGARTVTRIDDVDTNSPKVYATLALGSEPVCGALSPNGSTLYVTEWAEGNVAVVKTRDMKLGTLIESPRHPYGIAVTDEHVLVTEFYGELSADPNDLGKDEMYERALVRVFDTPPDGTYADGWAYTESDPIVFASRDSTFPNPRNETVTTTVGPNQLHSVNVHAGKVYVTATGTAPLGAPRFDANVFPMIYVADLATRQEDTTALGTQNLAALVRDNVPAEQRNFAADLMAIDFVPDTQVSYAVSRAGDVVQRLEFDGDAVEFGSPATGVLQIAVGPSGDRCQAPTGIATFHAGGGAWVNCLASFNVARLAFASQEAVQFVASDSAPTSAAVNRGRRFFHTGLAQWSRQAWSSCASCHPNGLSDNVTYQFPAGPRQSTELGSSFLEEDGELVQRIFNWTAVFDEVHDFAANTTLVQGGLRPLFPAQNDDCAQGTVGFAAAADFPGGLANPMEAVEDGSCNPDDFDEIEAYMQTIRPARGLVRGEPAAVERGRDVFIEGGCNNCHGGARSTLSRLFYEPSAETNALLASEPFIPPAEWAPGWFVNPTTQISIQDPGGPLEQGPQQVACVIREVGTFGLADTATTDAIERRANDARAQGEGGYNIPSLYGVALGAPYLHHGAAATLDDLFSDPAFEQHWQSGNANFLSGGDAARKRADLIAYLEALDYADPAKQPPAPAANMDGCPEQFPVPTQEEY